MGQSCCGRFMRSVQEPAPTKLPEGTDGPGSLSSLYAMPNGGGGSPGLPSDAASPKDTPTIKRGGSGVGSGGGVLPALHGGQGILSVAPIPGMDGYCLTGGEDRRVSVINWGRGDVVGSWTAHKHDVNRILVHDPSRLVVTCSRDKTIRLWKGSNSWTETPTALPEDNAVTLSGHTLIVNTIALNQSATRLVSGSRDNSVRLWDVETAKLMSTQSITLNLCHCVRWIHGQETVVQGGEDLGIRFWDARGGSLKLLHTITGFDYHPICVDVSADGNEMITGHNGFVNHGSMLTLWDLRTNKARLQFQGHQFTVRDVHFANSGLVGGNGERLVVSSSDDRTVKVWNREDAKMLGVTPLAGPPGGISLHPRHREIPTASTSSPATAEGDLFVAVRTGQLAVMKFLPDLYQFTPVRLFGEPALGEAN